MLREVCGMSVLSLFHYFIILPLLNNNTTTGGLFGLKITPGNRSGLYSQSFKVLITLLRSNPEDIVAEAIIFSIKISTIIINVLI